MYISTQTRDGDMSNFFKHENGAYPPSISQNGNLRQGTKAVNQSLVYGNTVQLENDTQVDAKVIDGPAVVQLFSPSRNKTFCDYAVDVFMPFIDYQLRDCQRQILYGM